MYQLPELYNTKNYGREVNDEEIELLKRNSLIVNNDKICCDKNVHELCKILMIENNYNVPKNTFQALELYTNLRRSVYDLL